MHSFAECWRPALYSWRWPSCYESHGIGPWALIDKQSEEFIGFCGVGPEHIGEIEEINLGYRLAKRFWGLGLATESVRAVLAYALGERAFTSVVVIIEPKHVASMRVVEKAGFISFQNKQVHGREVRVYRVIRDQWAILHNECIEADTPLNAALNARNQLTGR